MDLSLSISFRCKGNAIDVEVVCVWEDVGIEVCVAEGIDTEVVFDFFCFFEGFFELVIGGAGSFGTSGSK